MPTNSPTAFRTGEPELPPTVSQEYRKLTGVASNELLPVAVASDRSSKTLAKQHIKEETTKKVNFLIKLRAIKYRFYMTCVMNGL